MDLDTPKKFNHRSLIFSDLDTQDMSYGRGYHVENEIFPSITTVVGIEHEEHIEKWKNQIGEEKANKITKMATDKGTAFHEICEKYLNNDLTPELFMEYSPAARAAFIPVQKILDTHVDNIVAQEIPLFSKLHRVAGRVDLIAEYDNILSIIDFKTSSRQKLPEWIETYFMQETAYAIMLYEMKGIKINQIVTIMTVEEDEPQIFIQHPKDWFHKFVATRKKFFNKHGV